MRVGVIGVGRAGSVLAAALARAGHPVVAVHAVSDLSRLRADALLPGVPVVSVAEVVAVAELLLVTVPDDVLPTLIRGLAGLADERTVSREVPGADRLRAGQFLVHASGRYGIDVLHPASKVGALPLALHPVMTLTGTSLDLERLAGCPFGVTAPDGLRPVAEALVVEMGGEPIWVEEKDRPLYHAALANASNHLITLATQSMDLLARAGVTEPGKMLGPLMGASLDNALRQGDPALTGPVVRGDAGTVKDHLEALSRVSPEARAAYLAMARLTADRALAAGTLRADRAEALLDVLSRSDGSNTASGGMP